eukprot:499731-Rhodomonas_salina.1
MCVCCDLELPAQRVDLGLARSLRLHQRSPQLRLPPHPISGDAPHVPQYHALSQYRTCHSTICYLSTARAAVPCAVSQYRTRHSTIFSVPHVPQYHTLSTAPPPPPPPPPPNPPNYHQHHQHHQHHEHDRDDADRQQHHAEQDGDLLMLEGHARGKLLLPLRTKVQRRLGPRTRVSAEMRMRTRMGMRMRMRMGMRMRMRDR